MNFLRFASEKPTLETLTKLELALLTELAKHYPYSFHEVRETYWALDSSFDETIKVLDAAHKYGCSLRSLVNMTAARIRIEAEQKQ